MKVLFIGFVWPETTSTAASQNIISYLQACTEHGFDVHFACAAQTSPLSTDLSQFGVTSHQSRLNCSSFDDLVENIAPNIVVFDRFLTEEQFSWRVMKVVPDALRVLDIEDLHFVRHARHALYKLTGYQPKNPIYLAPDAVLQEQHTSLLFNATTTREMASIYRCDLILTLSDFERSLLINRFHLAEHSVVHIPYLLANNDILNSTGRKDFVSIGNFRHAPNIDAVNILIQHIWPSITKSLPAAKCHIYGSYLPPRIQNLHNPKIGLHIQGHIDDHHLMLSQAKVLLAPIQFGAGVKGKIVDALRCGLPTVTTPMGTEGIKYDQWPGAVACNRDEFIESAVRIYESQYDFFPDIRTVLNQNFDSKTHKLRLIHGIEKGLADLQQNRSKNFLQQMTSHHSLQTHQYMSQWIAAKNKTN